jgi:preprotein translocase subunit SecE
VSSILTARANTQNRMSKVTTYFKESYEELLHKTTWPTWTELQKTSVLVAVASIVIALLIFAMDKIISTALETFYDLF